VKSDTLHFATKVLSQLPEEWEDSEAILELVEGYIGSDKMVLLSSDGSYAILNEKYGDWVEDDSLWFSNNSYKKVKFSNIGTRIIHSANPTSGVGKVSTPTTLSLVTATTAAKQRWSVWDSEGTEFVGENCWACNMVVDVYDAEVCEELGASCAMCFDCMLDEKIAGEAYDSMILLRPVEYLDVITGEKGENHD
jgi:hypothetical protein